MENTIKTTIKSRQIAALIADGFDSGQLDAMKKALTAEGAVVKTVSTRLGAITGSNGKAVTADLSFLTASSVLFDAVYIPGGEKSIEALMGEADAYEFANQAYKHCKAICATGEGSDLLKDTFTSKPDDDKAVIFGKKLSDATADFIKAIAAHRNWTRESARKFPA